MNVSNLPNGTFVDTTAITNGIRATNGVVHGFGTVYIKANMHRQLTGKIVTAITSGIETTLRIERGLHDESNFTVKTIPQVYLDREARLCVIVHMLLEEPNAESTPIMLIYEYGKTSIKIG